MARNNVDAASNRAEEAAPRERLHDTQERKGLLEGGRAYPELDIAAPEWATEFSERLAPGMEVERIGRNGAETWIVQNVEEGARVYLVEKKQDGKPARHAFMHAVEVALEHRAASFSTELETHWKDVLTTLEAEDDESVRHSNAVIVGQNKADILYLAAERMTANPLSDPARELLRAKEDVLRDVTQEQLESGAKEHERIEKMLLEGQGAAAGVTVKGEHKAARKLAASEGVKAQARELLAKDRTLRGAEAVAEAMENAPEDLQAYMKRFRASVTSLDAADSALSHLRSGREVTEREKAATEKDSRAQRFAWSTEDDIEFGSRYYDKEKTELSGMENPAMLRAKNRFRLPKMVAEARAEVAEKLVGARSLRADILDGVVDVDLAHPRDLTTVETDLNLIAGDISKIEYDWKQGKREDGTPLPTPEVYFANVRALRQHEKALLAERHAAKERNLQKASADMKNLWLDTLVAIDKKQQHEQSISLLFRRDLMHGADPRNIVGALEHLLSSKDFDALSPMERRGCMTLLRSLRKEHAELLAPERVDSPDGAPETGEFVIETEDEPEMGKRKPPERTIPRELPRTSITDRLDKAQQTTHTKTHSPQRQFMGEQAWFEEGEREALPGAMLEDKESKIRTYTPSFRKFADLYGGPREFVRMFNEAKAKTNAIHFTVEDLRTANPVQRWWYQRQMRRAAREMLRQEAKEKTTRKRRGKLQA